MGSLLGVGVSLVGGLLGKKSKNKEADAIAAATAAADERTKPFIQPGVDANNAIGNNLGLNGPGGSQEGFNNYLGSTGFKQRLQRGSEAITGNQAAKGLLNSGSTLKALNTFGQDLAQTGFDNYLQRLGTVADRGVGAAKSSASTIQQGGQNAAIVRGQGDSAFQSGLGQAAEIGTNALSKRFPVTFGG